MDTKAVRLEIKDETKGEVSAVFSTFNAIDSDRDVTLPGAFRDGAPVRISAYGHTSWEGIAPVGRGTIRQTSTEAVMEGKFFLDTQAGHDTFKVVQHMGELQEWSYGFDVLKESFGEFNGQRVRFLEQLDVHEVSPVLLGAGVNTRTLSAKSAGPAAAADGLDQETRDWIRWVAAMNQAHMHVEDARKDALRREDQAVLRQAIANLTYWYVEVPAESIPEKKRTLAASAVADACIRLKHTPMPTIRWFRPETPAEADYMAEFGEPALNGFGWVGYEITGKADSSTNTLWIRNDRFGIGLYTTAAHEVAHLAGADEKAAQAYAVVARNDYHKRVSA